MSSIKEIESFIKEMDVDSALNHILNLEKEANVFLDKLKLKYLKKKEEQDREFVRLYRLTAFEREANLKGAKATAGIDEAGRGPLAGPVVAAAVILPEDAAIDGVDDSKKLSPKKRDLLYDEIINKAVAYGVGIVDEKEIDVINILEATKKAMIQAVSALTVKPDFLLIDSSRLSLPIRQMGIVKGDSLSASIAAASIIAKVTRDRLIEKADADYPQYGFAKHKGYGTKEHIEAIKKYGICPIHRVSFVKSICCP